MRCCLGNFFMTTEHSVDFSLFRHIVKRAEERLQTAVFSLREKLCGASLCGNDAAIHEDDLIGNVACKRHFMRYDDHGHIFCREAFDDLQHLARDLGVECGGRLVKAKHVGRERQGARDGNSLLLSARKLTGIGIFLLGKSDLGEK